MNKETKWKTTVIGIVGCLLLISKQWIPDFTDELSDRISITIDQVMAVAFLLLGAFTKDDFKISNFK